VFDYKILRINHLVEESPSLRSTGTGSISRTMFLPRTTVIGTLREGANFLEYQRFRSHTLFFPSTDGEAWDLNRQHKPTMSEKHN
jgi:hypothetical protein